MTDELEEKKHPEYLFYNCNAYVCITKTKGCYAIDENNCLDINKVLKTLRSKTLEERPPFCIACEPRIEELKILQARIKELENEKHLENIRVVQAARILELEDKLKTIRSKTRKEDAEIALNGKMPDYDWSDWNGHDAMCETKKQIAQAILKKEEDENER